MCDLTGRKRMKATKFETFFQKGKRDEMKYKEGARGNNVFKDLYKEQSWDFEKKRTNATYSNGQIVRMKKPNTQ